MSHPSSSHRISDKKSYYYNSSNPTNVARHGGSFSKKGYQGTNNGYSSFPNATAQLQPQSAAHVSTDVPLSEPTRHSRYDPNLPSRPVSSRVIGSRYNPEVDTVSGVTTAPASVPVPATPVTTTTQPVNAGVKTATVSDDVIPTVGSRYSGSRYNPQSQPHTSISKQPYFVSGSSPSASTSTATATSSIAPVSIYNNGSANLNRQTRPRSIDASKKELSYDYQPAIPNVGTNTNPNSTSGYYSRSNKWRVNNGPDAKLNYDNYAVGNQPSRPSFWKSQGSKYTSTSPVADPKVTTGPNLPTGAHSNRYNTETAQPVTPTKKESSEETESSTEKDTPPLKTSNPHSLGSSLINSVPQTTRRVEQQHATDHKRLHVDQTTPVRSKDANKLQHVEKKLTSKRKGEGEEEQTRQVANISSEKTTRHAPLYHQRSDGMWSSLELVNEVNNKSNKRNADVKNDGNMEVRQIRENEKPIFHKEKSWSYDDYEFIYDPKILKTNFNQFKKELPGASYTEPLIPIEECIFPMAQAETRLWELRNQTRDQIICKQKYLLRNPIKSLRSYPFIKQNILIYKQALRPLLCNSISQLKRYEYIRKLRLRKDFLEFQSTWEKNCIKMDKISNELRKEEIEHKKQEELLLKEREKREKELIEEQNRLSGSSRRRNRADFVDDAEIENVLLQIDPDYKHHQSAADIPPMIINPIKKYAIKFKNVNNLVTDKDGWASRVLKDGIDTFTEHEHELFVDGYLSFPKKFGKVSHYMGGLRSPEECVLHYYRTKNTVDYKKLLTDKNKRRQKGAVAKRRKKKDKNFDTDNETSMVIESENNENTEKLVNAMPEMNNNEEETVEKPIKQMEQIEIRLPQQDASTEEGLMENLANENEMESPNNEIDESTQEDEREKIYEEAPTTHRRLTEVYESDINKRPHEAIEAHDDEEKTIVEEDLPSLQPNIATAVNMDKTPSNTEQSDFELDRSDITGDGNLQRKKQKHSAEHKSSYWSVKEANLFPELLKKHGSQWSLISEKLGTKSTTMVRNYYQRNAAQLGWKSLVEEADFKRNVTSSGSVQQSQILIQAEQTPLTMSNGIPTQQRPALGFFSNQAGSEKRPQQGISAAAIAPTDETPTQPFTSDSNKEVYSQLSAPASALPPPRLPSIQLHGATSLEANASDSPKLPEIYSKQTAISTSSSPDKTEKPAIGSSIMSILNNDDEKLSSIQPLVASTSTALPTFNQLHQTQPTSAIRPSVNNVVVQELQKSSSSSPGNRRSSSISLLLNPDTERNFETSTIPVNPQKVSNNVMANPGDNSAKYQQSPLLKLRPSPPPPPPHNQPQAAPSLGRASNFNFAMDPLGALAAIASESLLPTKENETNMDEISNTNMS